MPKYRTSITIDGTMAREIEDYYRERVKEAATTGQSIPKLSNIYEDIIARGWEMVKKESKKR